MFQEPSKGSPYAYLGILLGFILWLVVFINLEAMTDVVFWTMLAVAWLLLPVSMYVDIVEVRKHTDWRPHRVIWPLTCLLPAFNLLIVLAYLWARYRANVIPEESAEVADRYTPSSTDSREVADVTSVFSDFVREYRTMLVWLLGLIAVVVIVLSFTVVLDTSIQYALILLGILAIAGAIIRAQRAERTEGRSGRQQRSS